MQKIGRERSNSKLAAWMPEIIINVIGWLVFILLAINVVLSGPLIPYDQSIVLALHKQALAGPRWVITLMQFFSFLGKHGITTFIVGFGIYWISRKKWREILMVILGVGGGTLLFWALAGLIQRPRPVLPNPFDVIPFSSFPSGHIINAVTFYVLLVYLVWPGLRSRLARALFVAFIVALLAMIAFSRIYLGDHYPTDVLAGIAIGLAWSALVYPGFDAYLKRRRAKRKQAMPGSYEGSQKSPLKPG